MRLKEKLRVALYADQASKVDFRDPEHAAVVRSLREVFGDSIQFDFVTNSVDIRSGYALKGRPHAIIIPGIKDETCHYYTHIGPEGNHHIRNFVEGGGVYLGFCSGAYYASSSIRYEGLSFKTRQRKELLGLFSAAAFGPIPGYCKAVIEKREQFPEGCYQVDPIPMTVMHNGKLTNIELPYGFGPYFKLPEEQDHGIRVTARYNGIRNIPHVNDNPPADIEAAYGRGIVIGMGSLPYMNYHHYPAMTDYQPTMKYDTIPLSLIRLRESLQIFHVHRQTYWRLRALRLAQHHNLLLAA